MDDPLGNVHGVVAAQKHKSGRQILSVKVFSELVQAACERNQSSLAVGIVPRVDQLPALIQRYDDPFLPLGRTIIDATSDLAAAYVFHLGAYLATGAAGAIALERTIAYAPKDAVKIIHAPFVSADYVRAVYEDAFGADAVTLATHERDSVAAYVRNPLHGVFIADQSERELEQLTVEFPGQVGGYRSIGVGHNLLQLRNADSLVLQWFWGDRLYTSGGEDFAKVLRITATQLRTKQRDLDG
ncbi:MAG: hypothetical protein KF726_01015 [Anaerolineae bacterium]|nr:hypothetical protein [Anaerolineae bacterium]